MPTPRTVTETLRSSVTLLQEVPVPNCPQMLQGTLSPKDQNPLFNTNIYTQPCVSYIQ